MAAWAKDPVPGAAGARPGLRSIERPGPRSNMAPAALGTGSFAHAPMGPWF